jgi:hypothetical protein
MLLVQRLIVVKRLHDKRGQGNKMQKKPAEEWLEPMSMRKAFLGFKSVLCLNLQHLEGYAAGTQRGSRARLSSIIIGPVDFSRCTSLPQTWSARDILRQKSNFPLRVLG